MKRKYYDLFVKYSHENKDFPGLCQLDISEKGRNFIFPDDKDIEILYNEDIPTVYWGRGSYIYDIDDFTPLRQNILLFLALYNNEKF